MTSDQEQEHEPDLKHILLVDDESSIRMLLRDVLETEGLVIHEAENGEEALKIIQTTVIELVVSDLLMPGLSGVDLLTEIKETYSHIPVLIITGKPTVEAAVDCMKGGAYDFLTKPFDILEFRNTVCRILEEGCGPKSDSELEEHSRFHDLEHLGDYTIIDTLGEGSSGVVFLVEKDAKRYALKVFKFGSVNDIKQEELQSRFLREAEFLSEIHHPNVVQLEEFGFSEEGIPYIVMEYLQGTTLKPLILNNDFSVRRKMQLILEVAKAVSAMHEKLIIHRDIKPDNIMILENGDVKLTDFGIIRIPDSDLTMIINIMGSPAYLAPEGFISADVDHRCDIFSIGVVTYELITGRRPFVADDLFSMANIIQTETPVNPLELNPDIPQRVVDIIARMLKKMPEDRYQTINLLIDDISNFMDPQNIIPELPPLEGQNWSTDFTPIPEDYIEPE